MINYELKSKLEHLALVGQNEELQLEWIGSKKQWDKVKEDVFNYENQLEANRLTSERD